MRATLHLTSRLLAEGCEPEWIESRAVGILRADGDGYTLRYTEKTEGGTLTCALSFSETGVVRIEQSGAISATAVFEAGVPHTSPYRIPPLSLTRTVTAREVTVRRVSDGFFLHLAYDAEIGTVRQQADLTVQIKEVAG